MFCLLFGLEGLLILIKHTFEVRSMTAYDITAGNRITLYSCLYVSTMPCSGSTSGSGCSRFNIHTKVVVTKKTIPQK